MTEFKNLWPGRLTLQVRPHIDLLLLGRSDTDLRGDCWRIGHSSRDFGSEEEKKKTLDWIPSMCLHSPKNSKTPNTLQVKPLKRATECPSGFSERWKSARISNCDALLGTDGLIRVFLNDRPEGQEARQMQIYQEAAWNGVMLTKVPTRIEMRVWTWLYQCSCYRLVLQLSNMWDSTRMLNWEWWETEV